MDHHHLPDYLNSCLYNNHQNFTNHLGNHHHNLEDSHTKAIGYNHF